jgi:hypothetical protein
MVAGMDTDNHHHNPEPWLSKKHVADHYSVGLRTVERWLQRGCRSKLYGGVRRLQLSAVDAFLAEEYGC